MANLGVDNIVLDPGDMFDIDSSKNQPQQNENKNGSVDGITPEDLFNLDVDANGQATIETDDDNQQETSEDTEVETSKEQTSNNDNVYQGLLKSLVADGVFSEEDAEVKDADTFKAYIDKQVNNKLDDYQKEIKHALDVGAEVSEVQLYQQAMNWLGAYNNSVLEGATRDAQQARANLIYRDYLNKGFDENKAKKLTLSSIKEGTDVQDAKEALVSCRDYFQGRYENVIQEAENAERYRMETIKKQSEELKKNILEKTDLFGGVSIDKATREKAYNAMTRVVGKDSDGYDVTAVQKYADDNPVEFRTALGIMYAVTDGFKNFDKIFNKAVDRKVNSKLDEFTKKITSQPHSDGGSISYKNGRAKQLADEGWRIVI